MLFRVDLSSKRMYPHGFLNLGQVGKLEKDLENIIAENIFDVLFEENQILVVCQERPFQPEADFVGLNSEGDAVVFELKTRMADEHALSQLFRYVQKVQRWSYRDFEDRLRARVTPPTREGFSLRSFHQEAFGLPSPLDENHFNHNQRMVVVGHSIDLSLIDAIGYWHSRGIDIDFIPYRIYQIGNEHFFEFFSRPYDVHKNPNDTKGVMFDTNASYDPKAYLHMLQKRRVAAFGDRKDAVLCFQSGDHVFLSHRYKGLIAAGVIKSRRYQIADYDDLGDEFYWDVQFETPREPESYNIETGGFLTFSEVSSILDRSFYWARTDKRPYLTRQDSEKLLAELKQRQR